MWQRAALLLTCCCYSFSETIRLADPNSFCGTLICSKGRFIWNGLFASLEASYHREHHVSRKSMEQTNHHYCLRRSFLISLSCHMPYRMLIGVASFLRYQDQHMILQPSLPPSRCLHLHGLHPLLLRFQEHLKRYTLSVAEMALTDHHLS